MKTKQSLKITLLVIVLVVSCRPAIARVMEKFSVDKPLPDHEIIFITEWLRPEHGTTFGFVQPDGSGVEYVTLESMSSGENLALTPPTWSSDGQSIFMSTDFFSLPTMLQISKGSVTRYALSPEYRSSGYFNYVSVLPNTHQAYFAEVNRIVVLELDKAPVVLVSYSSPDFIFLHIGANPLCGKDILLFSYHDKDYLQKGENLVLANITEETQIVLTGKDLDTERFYYPSCSPDGKWIAYSTEDGIYLIHPDGSGKRLLEPIDFDAMINSDTLPAVSWSPDGEWIVYHHCKSEASCNMEDESDVAVYKMNIETGQKIKLVDGGLFPYWRWPLTEPAE